MPSVQRTWHTKRSHDDLLLQEDKMKPRSYACTALLRELMEEGRHPRLAGRRSMVRITSSRDTGLGMPHAPMMCCGFHAMIAPGIGPQSQD